MLLEPSQRRTLPSESTWAAVRLEAGQFSAVLASGASGHRLFALQLQRGCRCAAQRRMYFWCFYARRGVVDPASLVCGRARGDE
jgi:hypothetical protein